MPNRVRGMMRVIRIRNDDDDDGDRDCDLMGLRVTPRNLWNAFLFLPGCKYKNLSSARNNEVI